MSRTVFTDVTGGATIASGNNKLSFHDLHIRIGGILDNNALVGAEVSLVNSAYRAGIVPLIIYVLYKILLAAKVDRH